MEQPKKTKRPVVLTVNGKGAAVMQDAEAYQHLLADAEESIRQGLDDVAHGRTRLARGVFDEIRPQTCGTALSCCSRSPDLEILCVEEKRSRISPALPAGITCWRMPRSAGIRRSCCPVAREGRKLKRRLRHLLYDEKPYVYWVTYEVEEYGQTVWVLSRHGARRKIQGPISHNRKQPKNDRFRGFYLGPFQSGHALSPGK
jgi:PHD/YefM family antitoxin component YafN of YafNO toxin-antitoxin module